MGEEEAKIVRFLFSLFLFHCNNHSMPQFIYVSVFKMVAAFFNQESK